jgi:uncharacterized protein YkwD
LASTVLGSAVVISTILASTVLNSQPAWAEITPTEMEFAGRINEARTAAGLPALVVQEKLIDKARGWSIKMREISGQNVGRDCKLSHNPSLTQDVKLPWTALGENVACSASDAKATHQAFMDSPAHRRNILDPKFDSVGVAVVTTGATMFVTEVFMQSKTEPSGQTTSKKILRRRRRPHVRFRGR